MNEQRRFLQRAWDSDRPATVPEMALQLAGDRHGSEGRELDPSLRIEPVDRIQQAEVGHLDQILDGFPPPREPPGEMTGERHEALGQLLPNRRIRKPSEQLDGSVRVVRRPIVLAHGAFTGGRVRNRTGDAIHRGGREGREARRSEPVSRVRVVPGEFAVAVAGSLT